mmetsp:Transcript_15171/g.44018  ORF Transcript_15171/g.44018 Transcript_15171/m.44018 type:complete len:274 (-) Transcript_15171:146-967(-)
MSPPLLDADPAAAGAAAAVAPGKRFWAYDSNNNELDTGLKAAHRLALRQKAPSEAELTEPIVIRNLLSQEHIEEILAKASEDGVWPRGVGEYRKQQEQKPKSSPDLSEDLKLVAHHYAWSDEHVVLYMHNLDHWFVRTLPIPWSLIRGGMESRHDREGVPVLADGWIASEHALMDVRSIELHHYSTGGGLLTPGHIDKGSELTMSVLLSDPAEVSGGDFVTYNSKEGRLPIAHKMKQGDAILFNSEKLHNISTIESGVRQSLVVELWPSKQYY